MVTPTPVPHIPLHPPAPAARTVEDAALLIAGRIIHRGMDRLDGPAGRAPMQQCQDGLRLLMDRRSGMITADVAILRMGVLAALAYQAAHRAQASGGDGQAEWIATHALRAASLALEAGTL